MTKHSLVRSSVIGMLLMTAACRSDSADVEILDERAHEFLNTGAEVEILGEGFAWTEGPVWVEEDGGYLLFSDIPNNVIHRYEPNAGISLYLEQSGATGLHEGDSQQGSNGLLLDADGSLVLMQQGDRRVARLDAPLTKPSTDFETLANRYDGRRFNSPNDAVFRSDGSLYFTDPPYGLTDGFLDARRELDFQGVFRLAPEGEVHLLDETLTAPNGIGLSPDENTLYVAVSDEEQPQWFAYDVNDDGSVLNRRVFYDAKTAATLHPGMPDGMAVHSSGVLFATGPGGVWLFSAEGDVLARIYTGRLTANCTLSADEKTLYMTAHDTLMKLELAGAGE